MASITSAGIGSGLDITSIVEQLVEVEISPKEESLEEKEASIETKLSAFGTLISSLDALQSTIENLADEDSFEVYSANSSDDDIFTATTSSSATPGTYTVEVVRTAQNHKLSSNTFTSSDTFGGNAGDAISITLGDEIITVDMSNAMNLKNIANAINQSTDNPGITATVVSANDGTQGLVITSDDSGYENSMTLNFSGGVTESTLGFETSNLDLDGNVLGDLAELDGLVVFDGYQISTASNTLEDIIDGVTLILEDADPGSVKKLVIEPDIDAVSDAVQSFVNAYNSAISTINNLSDYDVDTGTAGDLNGDSTLRMIEAQLRSIVSGEVEIEGLDFSMLWQIGIEFDRDGVLSVDIDDLENALETGFEDVSAMFNGTNGLAVLLEKKLDAYLESDGIFDMRKNSLNDQLDDIEDEWIDLEYRTELLYNRYLEQYTALDTLIAELNSTADYLTEMLTSL